MDNIIISENSIKRILSSLKSGKMNCFSVPEKYKNYKSIVTVERELGQRETIRIGYDVIRNEFFVAEKLQINSRTENVITWFPEFDSYYEYLDGQIYDNACYYQYDFSGNNRIDLTKIKKNQVFANNTIDDYLITPNDIEQTEFIENEKIKNECNRWIERCLKCTTGDEIRKVDDEYRRSALCSYLSKECTWELSRAHENLLIWYYIIAAEKDKQKFFALMDYFSKYTCAIRPVRESCAILNPEDVLHGYSYGATKGARGKQKQRLHNVVRAFQEEKLDCRKYAFFDERCHFYCEETTYTIQDRGVAFLEGLSAIRSFRFFESFEDFISYREGDLSNTDLSKNIRLQGDFSQYTTNENTILPASVTEEIEYKIEKKYSEEGKFIVVQSWNNPDHQCIKKYIHTFDFFFDFVCFLKGDLSGADLSLCDGLKNLINISGLDFTNSKVSSDICNKLGIDYAKYTLKKEKLESFSTTEKNEEENLLQTTLVKRENRVVVYNNKYKNYDKIKERIYYITDLHLLHRLNHFNAQSMQDVICVLSDIVDEIVTGTDSTILIGGDVSSDYEIFELFVKLLREELDKYNRIPIVIFVLGNHELWDFPECSLEEIVEQYRKLLSKYGMYLLQNDVLFQNEEANVYRISTEELTRLTAHDIYEKTRIAQAIYFGGLAFSGFNEEFNANNGIYRGVISREEEIRESIKFFNLYSKILEAIPDKPVVILTHTPMECWSRTTEYHRNYIYVSGHTHKNVFRNTSKTHLYADNQIGYNNNDVYLKWFDLKNKYILFDDYADGIYQISSKEYQEFYRGINQLLTFNRKVQTLYMLKKKGYYCFICESQSGKLSILNGSALKNLEHKEIGYYFDHMDSMIDMIENPLEAYTKIQKIIAGEIKKIGGSGNIHGCIIDIDFMNHIYVNPIDKTITGYWASDIKHKKVYPSIAAFLKKECPRLYRRYLKLLQENSKNLPALTKVEENSSMVLPDDYESTDIYKISREMKKMQKLNSKILTVWYDFWFDDKEIQTRFIEQPE